MNVERYRCFGATALNGNDAVVVSGPELSSWSLEDRQQFTIEQHAHACVFVDADDSASGQITLDFYYPHARSPLCLHASLAAAYYLHTHNVAEYSGSVLTSMNKQLLTFTHSGNELHISVEPDQVKMPVPSMGAVAKLLGCTESAIKPPAAIASIGSPKLLVEMVSPE